MSEDRSNLMNVIAVTFEEDSNAYAALTVLKELDSQHQVELREPSPEVIDTAMARLGGTVLRRLASEVEAEIAAAEHAQREAKRHARKELLRARHDKHVERIREKLAELMAKLHRHKKAPAPAA